MDYNIFIEPVLTSVITGSYRPSFSEDMANITVEMENQGVLAGEVNLSQTSKNIYANFEQSLEPNQVVIFTWTIEVFKSGN